MSVVLGPGPPADRADAARAQEIQRSLRDELPRARAAAIAWRNGLAGLLTGLVGFGLIRGRTEIDKVASPWHAVVGLLLLAALLVGTAAALWLLRACHGRPGLTPVDDTISELTRDHLIAVATLSDLRRGIVTTLTCAALLVSAVGTTWYAPAKSGARLRVQLPGAALCGGVVGIDHGILTLRTDAGSVAVDLATVLTVQPVEACP
jgi:hypothetical protein